MSAARKPNGRKRHQQHESIVDGPGPETATASAPSGSYACRRLGANGGNSSRSACLRARRIRQCRRQVQRVLDHHDARRNIRAGSSERRAQIARPGHRHAPRHATEREGRARSLRSGGQERDCSEHQGIPRRLGGGARCRPGYRCGHSNPAHSGITRCSTLQITATSPGITTNGTY
jgi:hypothetical protein